MSCRNCGRSVYLYKGLCSVCNTDRMHAADQPPSMIGWFIETHPEALILLGNPPKLAILE